MRKGKIFSGKSWKRIVRVLSCIVVFCTTYALILPAITQEAHAYCGNEEHRHTAQCYKDILSCSQEEHTHEDDCYDSQGNVICSLEEHTHTEDCHRQLLQCTEEEHTHSLECFSDPEADLETEEDWMKTIPDQEELKEKSDTEKVLMIAQSQKGYKESDKNYQVENETEKKGITRYGQWDEDPYEDWAGAYVRFVLYYAGIDTQDAKKHTSDWLEQLHENEELISAQEVGTGDVLFVYDEKDQLKAGIVSDVKDETIQAWMGDWDNEVQEKTFSLSDVNVHSAWQPIEKEEQAEPEQPEQPEEPKQEVEEPKPEEEEKPAETPKEDDQVVTYDFTQEVEAEDGAKIKVSWNAGTFETEDVVFQAKKVELTEEEQKKVQEQLDQDKSYTFRNYDLTFYVRDENMELQKVEPLQPVHVEIEFEGEDKPDKEKTSVFHFFENGDIESIEKTKDKLDTTQTPDGIRFKGNSFAVYTLVNEDENSNARAVTVSASNLNELRSTINSNTTIEITSDINSSECVSIEGQQNLVIDFKGHKISGEVKPFFIKSSSVIIKNASLIQCTKNDQYQTSSVEIEGNSTVVFENCTIQKTDNRAIRVKDSTLNLNNSNVQNSAGGILAENTRLTISGGSVKNNKSWSYTGTWGWTDDDRKAFHGGGIYAHTGSVVVLQDGAKIENNEAAHGGGIAIGWTNNQNDRSSLVINDASVNENISNTREGGGIALVADTNSSAYIMQGTISNNTSQCRKDWGGGGLFSAQGTYVWMPNGASIYSNHANGLGGGLAGCSTGKIYIDDSLHFAGDNTANADHNSFTDTNEATGGTAKPKDHWYIDNYSYNQGYKGEDVFGAETTEVVGVFSDGQKTNWEGLVGTTVVTDTDRESGRSLSSNSWMLLKANPQNPQDLRNQKVKIFNNNSWKHGGGVLINGYLVSGKYTEDSVGDYLNIKTTKKYQDKTGQLLDMDAGQFQFEIVEENGNSVLSSGKNDANGNVIFEPPLYVMSGKKNKGESEFKYFLLKEDQSSLADDIQADGKVYEIRIEITCEDVVNDFPKPIFNTETGLWEVNIVTLYKYKITGADYREQKADQDLNSDWQSISISNQSISVGGEGAFTNTKVELKSVEVNKKWEGDSENTEHDPIEVNLLRDLKDNNRNNAIVYKTGSLNSQNKWHITWSNIQATDKNDNPYEYWVTESNIPDGYDSKVDFIESTGGSQETVLTESVEAWVPATSIQNGEKYIIVNPATNEALKVQNVEHDYKINSNTRVSLGGKLNTVDGSTAYSIEAANEATIFTGNTNKKNYGSLDAGNSCYLSIETDRSQSKGLQILGSSNYGSWNDNQGFAVNESDSTIKGYIGNTPHLLAMCSGEFGSVQNGQSSGVKLFKQSTIDAKVTHITYKPVVDSWQITNTRRNYKLTIHKVDKDNPNTNLENAIFKLYSGSNVSPAFLVGEKSTDKDGLAIFEHLSPGTYTVVEEKAPDGYTLPNPNSWTITVTDSNLEYTKTIENELSKYELPETGSAGTKIYTATGTILLLTGTSLYRYKRRRRKKGGEAH